MNPYVAAVLGAGFGLGLFLTIWGLLLWAPAETASAGHRGTRSVWLRTHWLRLLAAVAVGAGVWWWTGWPVAGVGAAALVWWAKPVFGEDDAGQAATAKTEAVAAWTETLRDVLGAAAGLEQAIIASADFAPPLLEDDVRRLAAEIRGRRDLAAALADFATRVDDETADLVAIALTGAHRRAGDLAALLDRLADTARSEAAMRTRVTASRARVRTAARLIAAVTILMVTGLILLKPSFMGAYDGLLGQGVLAAVVGLFAVALVWLARLGRYERPPRLLQIGAGT